MFEFVSYNKNVYFFVDYHFLPSYNINVINKDGHKQKIANKLIHVKRKETNIMNFAMNRNQNGELITLQQACAESNLGSTTVRRLADESGAVRKIGKSYRIKKSILFDYIDEVYGA